MHLRIYLWLSCVLLAGYVRATEDAVGGKPTEETVVHIQNDAHIPPDHELFIDADEGSGLEPDESSGSGWGAGPGPDDEDGRGGSGDLIDAPPDDEDYQPSATGHKETQRNFEDIVTKIVPEVAQEIPRIEEPDNEETPEFTDDIILPREPDSPVNPSESPIQTTDSNQFYVPNTRTNPAEGGAPEQPRGAEGDGAVSRQEPDISIAGEDSVPSVDQEPSGSSVNVDSRAPDIRPIMNNKPEDRAASFFAQPGILAAVIGGAVVGLLCAILVVMFIVYRMRKKDEGSYALDEPKRSPAATSYGKGHNNREFYA